MIAIKLFAFLFVFNFSASKITVVHPKELALEFPEGKIDASYSLYGSVPYGTTTTVKLYNAKISNYKPPLEFCNFFDVEFGTNFNLYDEKSSYTSSLLVDRGTCSFVTKSREVQNRGFELAIIANNENTSDQIILKDDGTGNDIIIPTLLISLKDSLTIKKYLLNNLYKDNIILSIDFTLSKSIDVELNLFFASDDSTIYQFFIKFRNYFQIIKNDIKFNVRYVSWISDEYIFNTSNSSGIKKVYDNCYGGGRYCSLPKYDLKISDGRITIRENIRQKCIFNLSISNNNFQSKDFYNAYFDYMQEFYYSCVLTNKFNEECSNSVISAILTLKKNDIDFCIQTSFEDKITPQNEFLLKNSLLESDYRLQESLNVSFIPSVNVNKREIYGKFSPENVLEAVCGGFEVSPSYCDCSNENYYKNEKYIKKETTSNDLSTFSILVIILIVIIINIIIVYLCKRHIVNKMHQKIESSEINGKIDNVVSTYMALRDK